MSVGVTYSTARGGYKIYGPRNKLVEEGTGTNRYIGRIALEDDEHEPILLDWRAPASEAFYRATAVEPMGMVLRRHLITTGMTLVDIEDDLLSTGSLRDEDRVMLVGEAAILATWWFTNMAWLWYNVIGALVVIAAAWVFNLARPKVAS